MIDCSIQQFILVVVLVTREDFHLFLAESFVLVLKRAGMMCTRIFIPIVNPYYITLNQNYGKFVVAVIVAVVAT